jgi:hypothetical protein
MLLHDTPSYVIAVPFAGVEHTKPGAVRHVLVSHILRDKTESHILDAAEAELKKGVRALFISLIIIM